jgi:hypothetical protein
LNAIETFVEGATSAVFDPPLMLSVGAVTVRLSGCVAVAPTESVASTVNANVPRADGFPAIVPELEVNARPGGSDPANTLHEYGGVPPEAATVTE